MKLTFEAMQMLLVELQQNEIWAIHLMELGKKMSEEVTKTDLTNIIRVLCKNLNWIEVDYAVNDRLIVKAPTKMAIFPLIFV